MNDEIQLLETSMKQSILKENFGDISIDLAESFIDNLMNDETVSVVIKEIPIIKSIYAVGKTILGLRQKSFTRKLLKFLCYTEDIPIEKREEFINSLDEKTEKKASEIILQVLDNLDHDKKVEYFANLMKAKINGHISIETFLRLSKVLQDVFYFDLIKLVNYRKDTPDRGLSTESLLSVGLIYQSVIDGGSFSDGKLVHKHMYRLTELGYALGKYGSGH